MTNCKTFLGNLRIQNIFWCPHHSGFLTDIYIYMYWFAMVKTFLLIINFMKHSLLWKLIAISHFKFSGIYELHIRTGCKGFFPENVFASLALIITVRLFWQLGRDHLTLGRDQWLWEETNDGWKRQMTNWKRQLFLNGDRLFDNGKDYWRIGKTSPPYLMDTNHKKK